MTVTGIPPIVHSGLAKHNPLSIIGSRPGSLRQHKLILLAPRAEALTNGRTTNGCREQCQGSRLGTASKAPAGEAANVATLAAGPLGSKMTAQPAPTVKFDSGGMALVLVRYIVPALT